MKNTLEVIKTTIELYNGDGRYLILFVLCMFILWIFQRKNRKERNPILSYTLLSIFCFLCPVSAYILIKCIGENVYWRMFWILPIVPVIAYAAVVLLNGLKSLALKAAALLLVCLIIIGAGVRVYNSEVYTKSTNAYKLPEEVIAICDMIIEDEGEGTIKIAAPDEVNPYVRLYRADIKQVFGRESSKEGAFDNAEAVILYDIMKQMPYHAESVTQGARLNQCNYVVLKKEGLTAWESDSFMMELIGQTEHYMVFYIESI